VLPKRKGNKKGRRKREEGREKEGDSNNEI